MTKRFISLFSIALLVAFLALIPLCVRSGATAFADSGIYDEDSVEYSNVLDDLNKDDSFDERIFPESSSDYSLSVIQVAESVHKELFVYVYQPAKTKVTAKSINISTADTGSGETLRYFNYKLKLLNSSGVFFKYKVQNFTVSTSSKRFYDISNILRGFISGVDQDPGNDNTISEVGIEVAKIYCCETINGKVTMTCVETETIVITDKFVGFVEVERTNALLYVSYDQLHFIAFNCDHDIDDLLEADVVFNVQKFTSWTFDETTAPIETKYKTLYADNEISLDHDFSIYNWAKYSHTFSEIQSMSDFIDSVEIDQNVYSGATINVSEVSKINADEKARLQTYNWVLNYYKTEETISRNIYGLVTDHQGEHVTDVSVLRLKFVFDGEVYDLGVVDNKQTGNKDPIGVSSGVEISPGWVITDLPGWFESLGDVLKWVLIAVAGVLVLIVLGAFISWIVKIVERSERAKVSRQYRERKRK